MTSHGPANAPVVAAPAPAVVAASRGEPGPPEGINPIAGRTANLGALPVPPGASEQEVALGDRIYHGKAAGGTCSTTWMHAADHRRLRS